MAYLKVAWQETDRNKITKTHLIHVADWAAKRTKPEHLTIRITLCNKNTPHDKAKMRDKGDSMCQVCEQTLERWQRSMDQMVDTDQICEQTLEQ